MPERPGALYDLHVHSCLSPCADDDMTPADVAGTLKVYGFEVFAIADHNTCLNCPSAAKAAEFYEIAYVPAMELTTSEEAHVLCLLPDLNAALDFSEYVRSKLPDIRNDWRVFGSQIICGEDGEPRSEEERLLAQAADISVFEVSELMKQYGGAAIPAHIDRPSFSVLSQLAFWDEAFGFKSVEVYDMTKLHALIERFPEIRNLNVISDSDAHAFETLREPSLTLPFDWDGTAKSITGRLS